MYEWDDYFYDYRNERIFRTSQVKIGHESHEIGIINLKVNRFVDKRLKPKFYILGFPVDMIDVVTDKIIFLKNTLYVDADL